MPLKRRLNRTINPLKLKEISYLIRFPNKLRSLLKTGNICPMPYLSLQELVRISHSEKYFLSDTAVLQKLQRITLGFDLSRLRRFLKKLNCNCYYQSEGNAGLAEGGGSRSRYYIEEIVRITLGADSGGDTSIGDFRRI